MSEDAISRSALQKSLLNDFTERPGISPRTLTRIRELIINAPSLDLQADGWMADALSGAKADRDHLLKENKRLTEQLADAAKVGDGVWEWVPKPKYDALRAKLDEVRELFNTAVNESHTLADAVQSAKAMTRIRELLFDSAILDRDQKENS